MSTKKVFLGGTCNGSKWRNELIPSLNVDYFDPVVEDWNEEAQKKEDFYKENSELFVYVLTSASNSPFSIAEVVDDSNKRPTKVVFYFEENPDGEKPFTTHEIKALKKIGKIVEGNGAKWAKTKEELINFINQ